MKVGDLFVFKSQRMIAMVHPKDGKTGIYLGEDFIHRSDGVVVQNHKIIFNGEAVPITIDKTVLRSLKKL